MSETLLIFESIVSTAGDLMLCLGALAFAWVVSMEDGL